MKIQWSILFTSESPTISKMTAAHTANYLVGSVNSIYRLKQNPQNLSKTEYKVRRRLGVVAYAFYPSTSRNPELRGQPDLHIQEARTLRLLTQKKVLKAKDNHRLPQKKYLKHMDTSEVKNGQKCIRQIKGEESLHMIWTAVR